MHSIFTNLGGGSKGYDAAVSLIMRPQQSSSAAIETSLQADSPSIVEPRKRRSSGIMLT